MSKAHATKQAEASADKPKSESTEVAKTETTNLPATYSAETLQMMQGGDDFGRADLAIPFIKVAQKMSPEVDKDSELFLPGLEAGMIFNSSSKHIYKEGVVVIPVKYQRELLEWKPREKGGGLVNNFGTDLTPLTTKAVGKNEKGKPVTADGTLLVESGVYYVIVLDIANGTQEMAVINMTSSQFKPSREWNAAIRNFVFKDPSSGMMLRNLAPFAAVWKLTTIKKQKDIHTFYVWAPSLVGPTLDVLGAEDGNKFFTEAKQFRQNVEAGKVKVEQAHAHGDEGGEDVPF